MSGLAVIADWSSPGVSVEPVRRMLARVPHRGGDGTSALCRGPCAMGFAHRVRMARQRGAPQPFDDPRRGLVVVADARLDNRAELCALLAPGRAHDVCDAELIARGYDRWGTRLAERLLGDFALVVWDSNRQELYAARDPFATRPLYYRRFTGARNGPAAALASEVEQLLALEPGAAPIERRLVLDYLLGDYRHPRETFFQGIFRVLPGHWAVLSRSGVREARYWHPPKDPIRLPDDRAYAGELGRLLRQAVESRLESDGPLLAHLSGGIDSSSVVCIAHAICQEAKASVPAITLASAVYPGLACDESALIERVARSTRFPSLRWDGRVSSWAVGERPRTAYPWSDMESAGFGGDYVLAARLGARVLLTGYGGDEVFFERGVFRDLVAQGRWLRSLLEP
jgi:asparagine synthase (glutamine-hydrolysing)